MYVKKEINRLKKKLADQKKKPLSEDDIVDYERRLEDLQNYLNAENEFLKPLKEMSVEFQRGKITEEDLFPSKEKILCQDLIENLSGKKKYSIFVKCHKASIVGDTVGDPLKDTSGPSLNILIKLSSIISVVFGTLFVKTGFLIRS